MSKVFIEESTLTAIGDAIRGKTGKTELLNPTNMPAEIGSIQSGSGIPAEALNLTGNCQYRFTNNGWNWFVNAYGGDIKTQNITSIYYMFEGCNELQSIPFDINFEQSNNTGNNMISAFAGCDKILELPKINYAKPKDISNLFYNCQKIRYIPDDFYNNWDWSYIDGLTSSGNGYTNDVFGNCYSLRRLPINMMKHGNKYANYDDSWYQRMCNNCRSLDEIIGLPITHKFVTWKYNAFYGAFSNCYRLKELTFALKDDGTPYTMDWDNQTIDLTKYVGYAQNTTGILNYNSGITADKEVKDDATYNTLRGDPDWFTTDINYSRYSRASAIKTINSLPDTGAYGVNTIKFARNSGALTGGGAIRTLTAEEIAVATAKGWTVSLV